MYSMIRNTNLKLNSNPILNKKTSKNKERKINRMNNRRRIHLVGNK
jgi:hypothetical protein